MYNRKYADFNKNELFQIYLHLTKTKLLTDIKRKTNFTDLLTFRVS